MIPLTDLKAEYESIKDEIDNAINSCILTSNFIKGKPVADFEKAFAEYTGVRHCIGCGNGTDALEIILGALKIGVGDEVIVPALTWISTAEAVSNTGAEPVFVDVDPLTYTLDFKKIEEKITGRTRAIIPVHLYGCPADMKEITDIAEKHGLHIIEDCAQAHGAKYSEKRVGSYGVASGFSFFPSKNLGTYGDGGAILTDNDEVGEMARKISNHGQLSEKHKHYIVGRNSRLDTLHASILNVKLKHLDEWNKKRQLAAQLFKSVLDINKYLVLPVETKNKLHVYHQFAIRVRNRKELIKLLEEKEISWSVHYPSPLPYVDAYKYKKHGPDDFTVSQAITQEIISIPIFPQITVAQQEIICEQLLKYRD